MTRSDRLLNQLSLLSRLHRQKSCKEEGITGKPRAHESRHHSTGSRQDGEGKICLLECLNEAISRVANTGHTCVTDDCESLACLSSRNNLSGTMLLIMLMETQQPLVSDLEMRQQHARMPCILTADDIHARERLHGALRDVIPIANR